MKALWIVSLLLTGIIVAGQGFNAPSFSYFDTNKDGKISKAELDDGRQKRQTEMANEGRMLRNTASAPTFSEIDSNGDGYISQEEFAAHQKSMRVN